MWRRGDWINTHPSVVVVAGKVRENWEQRERGSQRIGSNPLIRQGIEASLFQSSLNCLFMEILSIVLGGTFPSST